MVIFYSKWDHLMVILESAKAAKTDSAESSLGVRVQFFSHYKEFEDDDPIVEILKKTPGYGPGKDYWIVHERKHIQAGPGQSKVDMMPGEKQRLSQSTEQAQQDERVNRDIAELKSTVNTLVGVVQTLAHKIKQDEEGEDIPDSSGLTKAQRRKIRQEQKEKEEAENNNKVNVNDEDKDL